MRQPSLIYARNLMILQHPLIVVLAQLLRPDGRSLDTAVVLWSLFLFIVLWVGVTWLIN